MLLTLVQSILRQFLCHVLIYFHLIIYDVFYKSKENNCLEAMHIRIHHCHRSAGAISDCVNHYSLIKLWLSNAFLATQSYIILTY